MGLECALPINRGSGLRWHTQKLGRQPGQLTHHRRVGSPGKTIDNGFGSAPARVSYSLIAMHRCRQSTDKIRARFPGQEAGFGRSITQATEACWGLSLAKSSGVLRSCLGSGWCLARQETGGLWVGRWVDELKSFQTCVRVQDILCQSLLLSHYVTQRPQAPPLWRLSSDSSWEYIIAKQKMVFLYFCSF